MPIKDLIHRFQPCQLYFVLALSIVYFCTQLVLSHITHALTLLMASHHMLSNIFALAGCIVTIKHSNQKPENDSQSSYPAMLTNSNSTIQSNGGEPKTVVLSLEAQSMKKRERREMKLRNTFGWTRIDVLTMLIVCVMLGSLSFSLLIESLQTLIHISHKDSMHLPIPVMLLGFVGLILNGLTYLLIGGYTMHQGSFLHITKSGNVVLDRAMSNSGELRLKPVERQLSKSRRDQQLKEELQTEIGKVFYVPKRQGGVEMLRDISSTVFVVVCGLIVYLAEDEQHTAKLVDPILAIFSCVLLMSLSYPYMKESCLILLQTIPGSIDIEIFERTLISKFPQIVSYHDLHIWQLTGHKYIATIHIKFENPKLYAKIIEDVRSYFHDQGITEVTIQPEFHCAKMLPSLECLVQCQTPECAEKVCCRDSRSDLNEVTISTNGDLSSNSEPKFIKNNTKETTTKLSGLFKFNRNVKRSQSTNDLKENNNDPVLTKDVAIKKTLSISKMYETIAEREKIETQSEQIKTESEEIKSEREKIKTVSECKVPTVIVTVTQENFVKQQQETKKEVDQDESNNSATVKEQIDESSGGISEKEAREKHTTIAQKEKTNAAKRIEEPTAEGASSEKEADKEVENTNKIEKIV